MTTTSAQPPIGSDVVTPGGTDRPSRAGYWWAGVLAVVGVVVAVTWVGVAVVQVNDHVAGFARVHTPGEMTVPIAKAGTTYVYFEGGAHPTLAQLDITVTDPKGAPVELQAHNDGVAYDAPTRVGHSVATFHVATSGRYHLAVRSSSFDAVVAVGDGYAGRILPHLAGAAALFLVTAGGALALAITTARRRSLAAMAGARGPRHRALTGHRQGAQ